MEWTTRFLVYPEDGDQIEIDYEPPFNQPLDINGHRLLLPLKNTRIIAYEVYSVKRQEAQGETIIYYLLELIPPAELLAYLG
jgi:hypothetical protein